MLLVQTGMCRSGRDKKGRKKGEEKNCVQLTYLCISTEPIRCCEIGPGPTASLAMAAWTPKHLKTLVWLCLTGPRVI